MGGLETPGLPVVTEEVIDGLAVTEEAPYTEHLDLSYAAYRVKPGDMIGIIAQENGITEDTIISVNNIRSSRLLQIGTYLKIPSMTGILYTVRKNGETVESIAQKYKIDADKCAEVNNLALSDKLNAGTTLFVPDAQMDWVTRQEINGDLFKKPIHARWYLTSRWGWRASPFTGARSYHSGVDMACPQGTNIYAAMDGKVTSTGYNPTYGNYVIVSHHSGYQTLYGHMSAILTVKGKYVTANSVIGKVGSTGLSTGPHLHFTVYKNGKTVNPQNLWN
ncbi:MAG: M23 family metallopeptidase [Treponema sp.]|nr:M23 family metallopeptidase [Treponema sp.]